MRILNIKIEGNTSTKSVYETKEYRLYINGQFVYTSNDILKVRQKIHKIVTTIFQEEDLK